MSVASSSPRRLGALAALALVPALALAGCGGSSGGHAASGTTTAASASATAAGSSGKPSSTGPFPTVSGSYGQKPTLTFPSSKPSPQLQAKVLHQGTGPVVNKGDLLVADYLGQVWGGKVFDNSYDRGQPAAFQIGAGKVIAGWDEGLVGTKSGSRVLLVIPPSKGYGSQGNTQAGIKGTDTLAFVVDVVGSYGKGATASTTPSAGAKKTTVKGVTITGAPGSRPTVKVASGTKPPTKTTTTMLAKGTGPKVKAGLVVVQYEAVTWAGQSAGSTWQDGVPVGAPVGSSGQGSPFDGLVGMPVGSRVLLTLPGQKGSDPKKSSVAAVVDIVAQPLPAKDAASQ